MGYRTLRDCVKDLERTGRLVRIETEIDPNLEAAEIHRRVFAAGGPTIYYARVKDCRFPMVSNLFGTMERVRFIFRDSLEAVRRLVDLKIDPVAALKRRGGVFKAGLAALSSLPKRVRRAAVLAVAVPAGPTRGAEPAGREVVGPHRGAGGSRGK